MRLDWLEPTLSEGGTTVGRACAVTIELVELCGNGKGHNLELFELFAVQIDKIALFLRRSLLLLSYLVSLSIS